jgi:regulator of sirC expression with transglutaminase-like and TPR domain
MNQLSSIIAATPEASPAEYLRRLGQSGDGPYDLATAALMLAALDHPDKKLAPFVAHLTELAEAVRAEFVFVRDAGGAADALASVIAGRYSYEGERSNYDDPDNADLMTVIDRRRGLPVALGILYMHAARANRIEACGLFSPGHFLLRVQVKGSEAVIDPFNGGAIIDRDSVGPSRFGASLHLREPGAGEQPDPFTGVSDSDVLLRLLNNIKNHALKMRDSGRASDVLQRMALIAPRRSILWLELGKIQESAGALSGARRAYENCLKAGTNGDDICNEAAFALHALKRRLN